MYKQYKLEINPVENIMNIIKMKLKKRTCPSCGSKKNTQFYKKKNFYRIDAIGNIYVRDNVYVSCQECLLLNEDLLSLIFGQL